MPDPTRALPLPVLVQKGLQNGYLALQRRQPLLQLGRYLGLVIAKAGVEILAVRTGAHGGTEDGFDKEAMVGLQRGAIGGAEGGAELVVRGGEVL